MTMESATLTIIMLAAVTAGVMIGALLVIFTGGRHMMRDLVVSIILFIASLIGVILIIESTVFGDEIDHRRPDPVKIERLMQFHGADCVYERDGVWYFDRDGRRCRL